MPQKKTPAGAGHLPPKSGLTAMLPPRTNHCFGCGPANKDGLRLRFYSEGVDDRAVCKFRLSKRFEGPPDHAHGGIIATLLDEAMGKANKLAGVVAMTRSMEVHYLRPVPLSKALILRSWGVKRDGRKHWNAAEISDEQGTVLATGTGLFIAIDTQRALTALARKTGVVRSNAYRAAK